LFTYPCLVASLSANPKNKTLVILLILLCLRVDVFGQLKV
jgi:hypothetical protein